MRTALRAKLEGGVVWLLCVHACFALVSHYPQIETNSGGSALRFKPPHHLPPRHPSLVRRLWLTAVWAVHVLICVMPSRVCVCNHVIKASVCVWSIALCVGYRMHFLRVSICEMCVCVCGMEAFDTLVIVCDVSVWTGECVSFCVFWCRCLYLATVSQKLSVSHLCIYELSSLNDKPAKWLMDIIYLVHMGCCLKCPQYQKSVPPPLCLSYTHTLTNKFIFLLLARTCSSAAVKVPSFF